jgi:Obg family GTPase CgtA
MGVVFALSARYGRKACSLFPTRPLYLSPSISAKARKYTSRLPTKGPSTLPPKQPHNVHRRSLFGATQPTHQSSFLHDDDGTLKPGQRIAIVPGGVRNKKSSLKTTKKPQGSSDRPFIDRIQIKTRGGSGGKGCISFHRLGSYKKRPCGGHGGKGGNVYLVTDPTLSSLKMEKHHYTGRDGGRGGTNAKQGKNGADVFVRIPCGVVVRRVLDWEEIEDIYDEDAGEEGEPDTEFQSLTLEDDNIDVFDDEDEEKEEKEEGDTEVEAQSSEEDSSDEFDDDAEEVEADTECEAQSSEEDSSDEDDDYFGHRSTAVNGKYEEIEVEQYLDTSSHEFSCDDNDDSDMDNDATIDVQEEDGFDAEYERMQSLKRQRKRRRKPRGTPSNYDDVVDQEVRGEDGMFHWSAPEMTDDNDQMAATAYSGHPIRKTVFLADLDQPHTSLLVAEGGKPGVGNQAYANRPYFSSMESNAAKKSIPGVGETAYLELELKLIADVGLVGFPNAGKSSLLSAMSRARPKIASYPFTTLHPLVGSIQYRDGYQVVMADVPGLIDGAAEGRGRGIEFLRHIERTKALVYMVDAAGVDGRDPVNDLKILGKELREYGSSGIFGENEIRGEGEYEEEMRRRRREIMNRPSLILANKMDLIPEIDAGLGRREELLFQLGLAAEEVGICCELDDIQAISAGVTGEGLRGLSKRLRQVVKQM